ncbi:hypothetical protein PpBr36_00665 [Pyricularia pennisetigena]|uniref:hypothetical protein n=1 Tax=Pyricularia pennisetigena TaxID=1578925 RepID=UPI00114E489B|nr:hypothetical protein PpBr36_00665 [Pyricularia pennisetigena]TLS29598.1 hypothetical protein PpBr36_00665 [Pyricularia pennisetigena]
MSCNGLHTTAETGTTQMMASTSLLTGFPNPSKGYVRKAYVDTPSGQVHYRAGRPPYGMAERHDVLVFLHRVAASSASFEELMIHYATEGFTSLAPDMPGFGASFDPSEDDNSIIARDGTAWYVNVLASALRAILSGVSFSAMTPRPIHILGHHAGAALAIQLASQSPLSDSHFSVVYRPPPSGLMIKSLTLVGPSIMSAAQRSMMKERLIDPLNQPTPDGSHLVKTWDYLREMGVLGPPPLPPSPSAKDLELHHRETLDHIRAWKGHRLVSTAVWELDQEALFRQVDCPVLALCATDDVLWPFFDNVRAAKGVEAHIIGGGNFSTDRDTDGVIRAWSGFLHRVGAFDITEPVKMKGEVVR